MFFCNFLCEFAVLFGVVDQEPDELQALVRFHPTVFPCDESVNRPHDLVIQIDGVLIVRASFPVSIHTGSH
ncbi:hypothetical protein EV129_108139 [Rhizobium azibense]|uniref:Uncharacterized protein n=1 Tax=Rhizobium azibense TaxID=1136135 RepID=A0A4R3RQD7_9HYPH|nr:hypothetical protein EV129_108139 [Rhizobium azibense]